MAQLPGPPDDFTPIEEPEDDFTPIEESASPIGAAPPAPEGGIYKNVFEPAYEFINKPLSNYFERTAEKDIEGFRGKEDLLNQKLNEITGNIDKFMGLEGGPVPQLGTLKSMAQGFGEGAYRSSAKFADQALTSPLGIAGIATAPFTGGPAGQLAMKAVAAPFAVHGAHNLAYGTPEEKMWAIPELAGGIAGLKGGHAPATEKAITTPEVVPPRAKTKMSYDPAEGIYKDKAGLMYDESGNQIDTSGNIIKKAQSAQPGLTTNVIEDKGKTPNAYNAKGEYTLNFANDVDKAMWMVHKLQPGPRYTKYLNYLVEQTGQSNERARGLSKEFGKYVEGLTKKAEPGDYDVPQIYGAEATPETPAITPEVPQEMRVPGINPETGRPNIAMGGASPQAYKGFQSMYSGDREQVVLKELIQNLKDEYQIKGTPSNPARVLFDQMDKHPTTNEDAKSITVKDNGRGLTPDQLYTIFTDLGESGKRTIKDSSGGFGFAKAAPSTLGKYMKVDSIVKEGKQNVKYSFEGAPGELLNQAVGVPLRGVPTKEPTGTTVKTYFPGNKYLQSDSFLETLGKHSFDFPGDIEYMENFGGRYGQPHEADQWIAGGPSGPNVKVIKPQPALPLRGTLDTPEATINFHYGDVDPTKSIKNFNFRLLNKKLYQETKGGSYGAKLPGMPEDIYADIISKVEEGEEGYPFTTNRENMPQDLEIKMKNWVQDNVVKDKMKELKDKTQKAYDSIEEFKTIPNTGKAVHFVDEGGRFTPDELYQIRTSQTFNKFVDLLDKYHNQMLEVADTLGWDKTPSQKLKKFGLLFGKNPEGVGTTLGIHIPDPSAAGDSSAILINPFEHFRKSPDEAASALFTTLTHEDAHIPGGGHDTGHSYRHADLMSKMGAYKTIVMMDDLKGVLGGDSGFSPEIQRLLQLYDESRGREASKPDYILQTGTSIEGPPLKPTGKGGNGGSFKGGPPKAGALIPRTPGGKGPSGKASWGREAYELARGTTPSFDISFPFNQGFGLVGSREWFKAYKPMMEAMGSERAFEKNQEVISNLPVVEQGLAHRAGLALMDLGSDLNKREELLKSTWAEKIPVLGRGVRASNRAYTAYGNSLRAHTFQRLYDAMPDSLKTEGPQGEINHNVVDLAQFINDATGRGQHKFGAHPGDVVIGGRKLFSIPESIKGVPLEADLQRYSKALNNIFFAPRKMSATVRMLNPGTYIALDPFVRQQYLKSLIRMGVAYGAIDTLWSMLGGQSENDPRSADFGKRKWGAFRIAAPGGMMPYIVLGARWASGEFKSSTSGRVSELGKGYKAYTRKDVAEQFLANKLHPTLRLAYDLADASSYRPFNVFDRTLQTYVPMVAQDLTTILRSDPKLLPGIAPALLGMGTQIYEKGGGRSTFIPEKSDIQFKGGPIPKIKDFLSGSLYPEEQ